MMETASAASAIFEKSRESLGLCCSPRTNVSISFPEIAEVTPSRWQIKRSSVSDASAKEHWKGTIACRKMKETVKMERTTYCTGKVPTSGSISIAAVQV